MSGPIQDRPVRSPAALPRVRVVQPFLCRLADSDPGASFFATELLPFCRGLGTEEGVHPVSERRNLFWSGIVLRQRLQEAVRKRHNPSNWGRHKDPASVLALVIQENWHQAPQII